MNRIQYPTYGIMAAVLCARLAHAHPGHSMKSAEVSHLLTSPYHLAVLALAGVGFILGGTLIQRKLPRQILRGGGALALGSAALIWGMAA